MSVFDEPPAYEEVLVPPFSPPPQELLDFIAYLDEAYSSLFACMHIEHGSEEPLTPSQVDALLTRGRL